MKKVNFLISIVILITSCITGCKKQDPIYTTPQIPGVGYIGNICDDFYAKYYIKNNSNAKINITVEGYSPQNDVSIGDSVYFNLPLSKSEYNLSWRASNTPSKTPLNNTIFPEKCKRNSYTITTQYNNCVIANNYNITIHNNKGESYALYLNGNYKEDIEGNGYRIYTLEAGGVYTFNVKEIDYWISQNTYSVQFYNGEACVGESWSF